LRPTPARRDYSRSACCPSSSACCRFVAAYRRGGPSTRLERAMWVLALPLAGAGSGGRSLVDRAAVAAALCLSPPAF
jgi:hypothetical protein